MESTVTFRGDTKKVLIAQLREIHWESVTGASGIVRKKDWGNYGEQTKFVFSQGLKLAEELIYQARNQSYISLDISQFKLEDNVYLESLLYQKTQHIEDYEYKRAILNGEELALLYNAISKNLFPIPKGVDLMYEDWLSPGSLLLMFQKDYYISLTKKMTECLNNGSFQNSNAYSEWINLKNKIDAAQIVKKMDKSTLKVYTVIT